MLFRHFDSMLIEINEVVNHPDFIHQLGRESYALTLDESGGYIFAIILDDSDEVAFVVDLIGANLCVDHIVFVAEDVVHCVHIQLSRFIRADYTFYSWRLSHKLFTKLAKGFAGHT